MLMTSANRIMLNALTPGVSASGTKLDIAYLEFVNGAAVTPPEINPTEGLAYYNQLAESADRDYLRVNVLAHKLEKDEAGRDMLTLIITSTAEEGVHGKPFSAVAGSRVYGLAVLASQANSREDLLFLRHYFQMDQQVEAPSSGSVMVTFHLTM